MIRDSGTRRSRDAGWLEFIQRWTVSHFATSIAAIEAGLGFGFIPQEKIRNELSNGELKAIPSAQGQRQTAALYIVTTAQSHAGNATKAVVEFLLDH